MLYERKIRYLDYYEGGMRVKGGGFAKLEVRDGSLRMELAVTGLHHTDTFVREVMLCGRGREKSAGRIEIADGKGQFKQLWRNLENIGDTGIGYGELTGIRIPLGAGRELSGRWQEAGAGAQPGSGEAASGRMGMAKARGSENGYDRGSIGEGRPARTDPEEAGHAESRPEAFGEGTKEETREEGWGRDEAGRAEAYEMLLEHGDAGEQRGLEEKDQEKGKSLEERGLEEKVQEKDMAPEKGMAPEENALEEKTLEKKILRFGQDHAQTAFGAMDVVGGAISGADITGGPSPGPDIAQASLDRERPVKGSMEWKDTDAQPSRRKSPGEQEKEPVRLMEDKWPQLWAIYPHIRPFQDEREYLSIGPSDFVLFPESSYRAVNNSFLLHGYYNYRHLILGRMERKGESCYYIGVPGNFYEREKQVAIMFGFESFECAEEPAQAGDFGYYMMRIWI